MTNNQNRLLLASQQQQQQQQPQQAPQQTRQQLQATTTNTNDTKSQSTSNDQQNIDEITTLSTSQSDQQQQQQQQLSVDDDFDLYWREEARNPHRNRIRIGRQYQATVPSLLKPGEKDSRKLNDLETLSFCPKKSSKLSDAELDHYFTIAKSLNIFASLVETRSLLGRDVTIADLNHIRHKEGLSLASVIQPSSSSPKQTTLEQNQEHLNQQHQNQHQNNEHEKQQLTLNQPLMRALSHFISLHHPCHHDKDCKKLLKETPQEDNTLAPVLRHGSFSGKESKHRISRSAAKQQQQQQLLLQQQQAALEAAKCDENNKVEPGSSSNDHVTSFDDWTREEVELFSKAIEVCGKNFGSIKKEFLPSKSVKSIVEYYYIGYRDSSDGSSGGKKKISPPADPNIHNEIKPQPANPLSGDMITTKQETTNSVSGQTNTNDIKINNIDKRLSVYNFDDDNKDEVPLEMNMNLDGQRAGPEVRPLKAKPVLPSASGNSERSDSDIGSLKFFMDGQLVLKLNACQDQQLGTDKCQWVQSDDNNDGNPVKQKKHIKRTGEKSLNNNGPAQQNGTLNNNGQIINQTQDDMRFNKNDYYKFLKNINLDEDSKESMNSSASAPQLQQQQQPSDQNTIQQTTNLNNNNHQNRSQKRQKLKNNNARNSPQTQTSSPSSQTSDLFNGMASNSHIQGPPPGFGFQNHESIMNAAATNPMISQAMPWLQANQFAMAAALLGGHLNFPTGPPIVPPNMVQLGSNVNTATNQQLNVNNISQQQQQMTNHNNNNSNNNNPITPTTPHVITTKPMDLSLEHNVSPKSGPQKSATRDRSRNRQLPRNV